MKQIDSQIKNLSHKNEILNVIEKGFLAILLPEERLAEVANFIAPEHLELQVNKNSIDFYLQENYHRRSVSRWA